MKNLIAILALLIVGCSSITFNPSADYWVSVPSTSLCFTYYSNYGVARDKTWRLTNYNRIINEIDRRGISCKTFAKASDKDWMRGWVNKNSNQYSTRLKYEKDWEEHSQKVFKEEKLAKEITAKKEEEQKKLAVIHALKERCISYGFTGDKNITTCVQREAQHDYEIEQQQYQLQLAQYQLRTQQNQNQLLAQQSQPKVAPQIPWYLEILEAVALGLAEGIEDGYKQKALIQRMDSRYEKKDIYKYCRPKC